MQYITKPHIPETKIVISLFDDTYRALLATDHIRADFAAIIRQYIHATSIKEACDQVISIVQFAEKKGREWYDDDFGDEKLKISCSDIRVDPNTLAQLYDTVKISQVERVYNDFFVHISDNIVICVRVRSIWNVHGSYNSYVFIR